MKRLALAPLALVLGCSSSVLVPSGESGSSGAGGSSASSSSSSSASAASSSAATGAGGSSVCPTEPWALRFGDDADQIALSLAADPYCNLFVAADVAGSIDFGNGPLKGKKYYQGTTLARLDPYGKAIWSKWLEGAGVSGIAADPSSGLYVSGQFNGTTDLGTGPITAPDNHSQLYVARFDSGGQAVWARHYEATLGFEPTFGSAITVAPQGGVLVAYSFMGTADLGDGPTTATGLDIAVIDLDPEGEQRWSRHFPGAGNTLDAVSSLDVAPDGTILLGGEYEGAFDPGDGPLPHDQPGGLFSAFVAELDAQGKTLWSRGFRGPEGDLIGTRAAIDPAHAVTLLGVGAALVNGQSTGAGLFQIGLDPAGNVTYARGLGGTRVDALARGAAGDWLLAGQLEGGMAQRIDAAGATVWSRGTPSPLDGSGSGGRGIAVDPAGNVLVAGTFAGTIDLGSGALASAGKHDVFVAKLAP